ncbi:MAG: hypothetical protein ACYCYI_06985 [Saccharofermentanales bacterium]
MKFANGVVMGVGVGTGSCDELADELFIDEAVFDDGDDMIFEMPEICEKAEPLPVILEEYDAPEAPEDSDASEDRSSPDAAEMSLIKEPEAVADDIPELD